MTTRIVVDAMGGDNAPQEIVAGALMAYKWFALRVWIAQERERSKLKDEEKLREKW